MSRSSRRGFDLIPDVGIPRNHLSLNSCTISGYFAAKAGIAQLARASAFQAEGRGFESRFPLHYVGEVIYYWFRDKVFALSNSGAKR